MGTSMGFIEYSDGGAGYEGIDLARLIEGRHHGTERSRASCSLIGDAPACALALLFMPRQRPAHR